MKKKKNPIYHFLDRNELLDIIKKIDNVKDFDTKSRFYLVTLKYKSVEIQNFKIEDAEELVNREDIPEKITKAIQDSLARRKISIEANNLKEDTDYLFVNSENKKIHDCVLLREWRNFLSDNNLDDINLHVFKQSISYIQWKTFLNEREKNRMKLMVDNGLPMEDFLC